MTISIIDIKSPAPPFFMDDGLDFYRIYGGQDGDIDWAVPVALMALDATDVSIEIDLPPNTTWHFVRCLVRGDGCERQGPASDACIVYIDENGDMRPASLNSPTGLTAEPRVGGTIRLRWYYFSAGQDIAPTEFQVYIDGEPAGTVTYNRGHLYSWTSDALTHGQEYEFLVTAVCANGESQNEDAVTATADGEGPAAITGLIVSYEEE